MEALRAFLLARRRMALALLVLALGMKALMPAGFMVASGERLLSITICSDTTGEMVTKTIAVPLRGDHAPQGESQPRHDGACAFSLLGHGALAGADVVLLAAALAFILALGFLPLAPPRPGRIIRLRPPLRGPPLFA